jgi:hypothetical protein
MISMLSFSLVEILVPSEEPNALITTHLSLS